MTDIRALKIGMWWPTEQRSGGLDRVYANFVDHLPQAGVRVSGLVEGPRNVCELTAGRVECFAPRAGNFLARRQGLRRAVHNLVRSFDPQVVGVHFALYAAMAGRRLGHRPLVVHFHGPWSGESSEEGAPWSLVALKRLVERRVYHRAERIVVLSNAFGRVISEEFGVPESVVRLVPGHVDIQRFAIVETKMEARRLLGWPLNRPILVTVRRLSKRMGLDRLVTAMRRIVTVEPDVLLYIAGTGALAEPLRRQVAEAGLDRHIQFLGFVPDAQLPLVFRAADINVVPTIALEGFGLTAAEALAAGTPSMASPIGGLPEVVGPLSPDLVFQSSAPDDIADGLIAGLRGAITLPDLVACQTYAASRFAPHLAALRLAAVYREIAA